MVLNKPLTFSLAVHAAVLSVLLVAGFVQEADESVIRTVRVRLSGTDFRAAMSRKTASAKPEDTLRDIHGERSLPDVFSEPSLNSAEVYDIERADVAAVTSLGTESAASVLPVPPRSIVGAVLDPLAGMEDFLPAEQTAEGSEFVENWSLSWEDGRERGILSSLEMDIDSFPETPERLLNAAVAITVSPGGEVLAADIADPGSGDVRIDRYLVSWALNLVFEPIPEEHLIQQGVFRLVFKEGTR